MGWDIVKDIVEIAGTVGTAIGIGARLVIKARLRDQAFTAKFEEMGKKIAELEEQKVDKATYELENRHVTEGLKALHADVQSNMTKVSTTLERISESLAKLDGTVETFMKVFKPGNT